MQCVQLLLPLLLLGPQVLLRLVELLVTQCAHLLGLQIQGLVLLEVFFLGLIDDAEDPGNGLVDNTDLGQLRCRAASELGDAQLPQLHFEAVQLLQQLLLLPAVEVLNLDLGRDY